MRETHLSCHCIRDGSKVLIFNIDFIQTVPGRFLSDCTQNKDLFSMKYLFSADA